MNKKLVGLIVSAMIIVLLIIGVFVGKVVLVKDSNDKTPIRQTEVQETTSRRQETVEKPKVEDKPKVEQPAVVERDTNEEHAKTLVNQVVSQSTVVGSSKVEITDESVILNPLETSLVGDVYELTGVVTSVDLLGSSNQVQAQYRVEVTVGVGDQDLILDYFTTSQSLNALSNGVSVAVRYQLTEDKHLVIHGLRLIEN